jgi:predicted nucleotidyltransferase
MIDSLQLDLSEQDLRCVLQILSVHVPDRPVYAFGSRASGRARRRSDLDLAIGGDTPLTLRQRALLNEEFSESDLPIFVDVLDLNAITPEFRRRIERDFVTLQDSAVLSGAFAQ